MRWKSTVGNRAIEMINMLQSSVCVCECVCVCVCDPGIPICYVDQISSQV